MRKQLESEIERLKSELKRAESSLVSFERNCSHSWGQTLPDHIYTPGYTDPGDEPGTMGVDFRGPCYVPSQTIKRWKRVCSKCGKVEYTTNTSTQTIHTPKF